jgi:CubicO group peptidase (beta-lactamase class C family)
MIESGVAVAGVLAKVPEYEHDWGKADAASAYFDLASLTKVVVTNSLLLELISDLGLSVVGFRKKRVGNFLPQASEAIKKISIEKIWDHTSGLRDHFLLNSAARSHFSGTREELWSFVLKKINEDMKKSSPAKAGVCVYSDLNYWILGAILETHFNKDLSMLWQEFKKKYSLPTSDLIFGTKKVAMRTEQRHAVGEVNDDNAFFMQQIAPHSGVFGTSAGVWKWMSLMQNWRDTRPELESYFTPKGKGRFWCGWDRPTGEKTLAGKGANPASVIGHLGYTGTALWWDPLTKWGGILLTNRIFPSADQNQTEIRELRIKFFTLLWHNKRKELWKVLLETMGRPLK